MDDKKNGLTVKVAVLSCIILQYTNSIITPALGAIAKAFPTVNPEIVKQIQSLPGLIMIFAALLAGQLTRYMKKKQILYIAIVCIFVSGIVPAFYGDIYFILAMRILFGLGYGLIFPLASTLIADLFEGKERDTLMGYKSAVGALAGVIYQIIAGVLAAIFWRYTFFTFLITIPFILLIILKLPEPELQLEPVVKEGNAKAQLTIKTWAFAILLGFTNLCFYTFMTNTGIVIEFGKLGTPAQTGLIMATFYAAAFLAGLLYGNVTARIFRKFNPAISLGLLGVGLLIEFNAYTIPMFFLAAIIFGLGFGTYNPEFTLQIIKTVQSPNVTLAVSLYVAFQGLGMFLSPIALSYATMTLGIQGPRGPWVLAAGVLLISFVVLMAITAISKLQKVDPI